MKELAHTDLIALDDFGLEPFQDEQQRICSNSWRTRYELRSTLITSQYPIAHCMNASGNPTLPMPSSTESSTMPINSNLQGESLRKQKRPLTTTKIKS